MIQRKTLSYLYRRQPVIFKAALKFFNNPISAIAFCLLHFRVRNYTHASISDLLYLQSFVRDLHAGKIAGDIVECGSWRGGSSAIMYKQARDLNWANSIYIYDSFEGFPEPDAVEIDGVKAQGIKQGKFDWIKASEEDVVAVFKKLDIFTSDVHIVKGWFNETTPHSPVQKIALLHCDGDLYESTRTTLESFYHKVVPGGYIVSNDYGDTWIGAKKAFDEWILAHCPQVSVQRVPGGGAYFKKP
jgi:O-methyltransferase